MSVALRDDMPAGHDPIPVGRVYGCELVPEAPWPPDLLLHYWLPCERCSRAAQVRISMTPDVPVGVRGATRDEATPWFEVDRGAVVEALRSGATQVDGSWARPENAS